MGQVEGSFQMVLSVRVFVGSLEVIKKIFPKAPPVKIEFNLHLFVCLFCSVSLGCVVFSPLAA